MKKILLTLTFAGAVAFAASAQNAPSTAKVCTKTDACCQKGTAGTCCSKGSAMKTGTASAEKTVAQKKQALASANNTVTRKQVEN